MQSNWEEYVAEVGDKVKLSSTGIYYIRGSSMCFRRFFDPGENATGTIIKSYIDISKGNVCCEMEAIVKWDNDKEVQYPLSFFDLA